jgi:hypothetical protein
MNNGIIDVTSVREQVAGWLIAQVEQTTPEQRERLIRLLVNRLSRQVTRVLYIAVMWHTEMPKTTESES